MEDRTKIRGIFARESTRGFLFLVYGWQISRVADTVLCYLPNATICLTESTRFHALYRPFASSERPNTSNDDLVPVVTLV